MKETTSHEHYVLLLSKLQKNKRHTKFKTKTFVRSISKHFYTRTVSDTLFFITLKGSKISIMIEVLQNDYFKVKKSFFNHYYQLNCISPLDLLNKLIKHQIIKP